MGESPGLYYKTEPPGAGWYIREGPEGNWRPLATTTQEDARDD